MRATTQHLFKLLRLLMKDATKLCSYILRYPPLITPLEDAYEKSPTFTLRITHCTWFSLHRIVK